MKAPIIGIDLGTTNSCVAVFQNDRAEVIPNKEGARTTPSIVAFTERGDRLVGQIAKRQALLNPANTIFAVKRLIGRKYQSPPIQQALPLLPYKIVPAPNGDIRIVAQQREYSPEEISAYIRRPTRPNTVSRLSRSRSTRRSWPTSWRTVGRSTPSSRTIWTRASGAPSRPSFAKSRPLSIRGT